MKKLLMALVVASIATAALAQLSTSGGTVDVTDRVARALGRTFLRNPSDTANMGDLTNPIRIDPTGTTIQPVSALALPLPTGAATLAEQLLQTPELIALGNTVETPGIVAPAQAQFVGGKTNDALAEYRLLPLGAGGRSVIVEGHSSGTPIPVSGPLTDAQLRASAVPVSMSQVDVNIVAQENPLQVNPTGETAGIGVGAAADAEASGNGSVIGILKRLRTLLSGGLPSALVGGRLDTNAGSWLGSTAPTVGQKAMASSIPVAIASDQSAVPISGTVTSNQGGAPWSVTMPALTSLATGQQAVTASAVALPSSAGKIVCVRVKDGGTQNVYYGPSGVTTSTGQELVPGEGVCRPLDNANRLFVIAAGGGSTVGYEVIG